MLSWKGLKPICAHTLHHTSTTSPHYLHSLVLTREKKVMGLIEIKKIAVTTALNTTYVSD